VVDIGAFGAGAPHPTLKRPLCPTGGPASMSCAPRPILDGREVGILASEDYTIEKVLSSTSSRTVHSAVRASDGKAVVLKSYKGRGIGMRSRARLEFDALRMCAGPGVVEALAVVEEDGADPVLVLGRLDGIPLGHWPEAGLPSVQAFLEVAVQLAGALCRMHDARLVHRDIRPEHVLVDAPTLRAHWIGFGLARPLGTATGSSGDGGATGFVGLPRYIAPEQTGRMGRGVDARSDLYAFGATLYFALVGVPPFEGSDPLALIHAHMARRPPSPLEKRPDLPPTLARILLKLLQKEPEDRYQTAAALQRDLMECSAQLARIGRIDDDFPLGSADRPQRPLFARKLYGREAELSTLRASYARATRGTLELLLLSGPPGSGKSTLLHELRGALPESGGYLAAGKFDLYRRDVPYAGLLSALGALIQQILTESEARVERWRERLAGALGGVAGALIEHLPDLGIILDGAPPVPNLGPVETQARLALAVRRFIRACAQKTHPLVLFFDDMQWADPGSFELLDGLLRHAEADHLLVAIAYRSNEVDASHPLHALIEHGREHWACTRIELEPLASAATTSMLADALHRGPSDVERLAACLLRKTGSNPLLIQQFILHMHAIGLIRYVDDVGWTWEENAIESAEIPEGAVALLVAKLDRLEPSVRELLVFASCVAYEFDAELLAELSARPRESLEPLLYAVAEEGLLAPSVRGFRFVHDRVREAARGMLSEEERSQLHSRIARHLLETIPAEEQPGRVFEIVEHLNGGIRHLEDDLHAQAIERNVAAGQRSLAAGVATTASSYFTIARELFRSEDWEQQWALGFELWLQSAEAAFQTSAFLDALAFLDVLEQHPLSLIEATRASCKRIQVFAVVQHPAKASAYALGALRRLGVRWPLHPSRLRVEWAVRSVQWRLRGRTIEGILSPTTSFDLKRVAPILILEQAGPIMAQANVRLTTLAACHVTSDYARHGYIARPAFTLAAYALFSYLTSGDATLARRIAAAALDWCERVADPLFGPRTELQVHALLSPWLMQRREALRPLEGLTERMWELGDSEYAYYASFNRTCYQALGGAPVASTEQQLRELAAYATRGDERYSEFGRMHRAYRPLHAECEEDVRIEDCTRDDDVVTANSADASEPAIRTVRLMTLCVYGEHERAFAESELGLDRLFRLSPWVHVADHTFYRGLAAAALVEGARGALARRYRKVVRRSRGRLRRWSRGGPDFEHMALLLEAEQARFSGKVALARRCYQQASQRAAQQSFVHHSALAHERHARMLVRLRRATESASLLAQASALYLQWGARNKAAALEREALALRRDDDVLASSR
jgi:serine/threonine protein kinase